MTILLLLAAIFIHESGHAAAATALRHPWQPAIVKWHGIPAGPAIRMLQPAPRDHAIIAIAGPAANVLSAIAAWQISPTLSGYCLFFGIVSLIPAKGLDGWHFRNAVRTLREARQPKLRISTVQLYSESGSALLEYA